MSIGNIVLWIIFGGLAGWIASIVVGGDAELGLLGNIVVGVIGAFLGGWIADRIGVSNAPGTERPSTSIAAFITAVVGAILLLIIINLIF